MKKGRDKTRPGAASREKSNKKTVKHAPPSERQNKSWQSDEGARANKRDETT